MAVGYLDQFIAQGTSFTTQLTLDDDSGNPFNLTGFTAASQARRSYYSANASIVFATTISDAANGVITLSTDANTTANVPAGRLVYDVKITNATTGQVTRVLEGLIFVSPEATQ